VSCDLDGIPSLEEFIPKVAKTTVYVQYRSPHSVLGNKTPKEMFLGEKPEVNHLRIFGCLVYVHVPREKRSKLEPLGKKDIFVGYSKNRKHIESTFLVSGRLRLVEMLLSL